MEDAVEGTVAEAMKQVGAALAEAAREYGPGAVDLALMAYRVDAAQQLLYGAVCLAITLGVALSYRKLWRASESWNEFDRDPLRLGAGVCAVVVGAFFFSGAFALLIDASAWIAAFGYPELRIAMKALEAAGLM